MGLNYNVPKLLSVGSQLVCVCNSGAKKVQIIGVLKTQGTRKRRLRAGVGSVVSIRVTKGLSTLKKKVSHALIIRQKYPITRKSGPNYGKISFEDNACVILESNLNPKKSVIKGPVAKEVANIKKYSELKAIYK